MVPMPDADFTHLFLVARLAIARGDRRPAETLFRSYRNGKDSHKAQKVAALLGSNPESADLPPGLGPTPWAAAHKLRQRDNPVINFTLTGSQIQAADSIQKVFHETTRALSIWQMPMDSIQVDATKHRKDPWLSMPDWAINERISVYVPWLAWWGCVQVIERPHQTLNATELTMLIVIDGHSVNAIGRSWRADPKRLRHRFRQALDGYAKIKRAAREERDIVEGGL